MNNTKSKILLFVATIFMAMSGNLSAQNVTLPRASPNNIVTQKIGLSTITIDYHRPALNDRELWGSLVPYGGGDGNQIPWRAGANENTVFTLSHAAKIEGKDLAAGTYGIHMAPHENGSFTVMFSSNSTSWGSFSYDPNEDVLRVDVTSAENQHTESLTYSFVDVTSNSVTVAMDWGKTRVPFKVEFDVHEIVLANARNELRSLPGFSWQGPLSAASYCMNNNINHEEALQWVEQSINRNKNWNNVFVKASLLAQTGDESNYEAMVMESSSMASTGQRNFLGYQLLGLNKNDLAIKVFQENVEKNPENANCHDSLGEAYKINGDKDLAISELKTSLSLDPPSNVRANSIKLLKELGVDTSNL